MNQEPEDGRRCTKRGDVIVLYLCQNIGRSEFLVVVYKDVGSGYPLSVQLAPYGFTPARIGNGEVQAVFVQVVPEISGNDVPQRIREVVRHHFGFAGSAAGEVHQRNIVVAVGMLRSCERGGIGNAFVEVLKTFGYLRAYADQLLHTRRVGHGSCDVVGNDAFAGTDNHLDVCGIAAVYNIFLGKQVCGGDNDGSQLMQCDDAEPELIAAFQNEHYHIAVADAETLEIGSRHVRIAFHVGK